MRIDVLDHGYVELIESWGSDERIVEAARMSTAKGFLGWGSTCSCIGAPDQSKPKCPDCGGRTHGDEKLLSYLWTHKHTTPFEMAGFTIEVQAPIFVFREWHRHRTQSYNELSARYTPLPDVNYVPSVERLMMQNDGKNRQASGVASVTMTTEGAEAYRAMLVAFYAAVQRTYERTLGEGLPKEIARIVLPVGRYSRMRASTDLWNWLHFLRLRLAPDAQWEIRQYAQAVEWLVAEKFPRTYALFAEAR